MVLHSEQSLNDARYFLLWMERLKEKPDDVIRMSRAFCWAVYSVFDHLLEDYQEQNKFGIPIDSRSIRSDFKDCVQSKHNPAHDRYYEWWKEQEKAFSERDSDGQIVATRRHRETHRAAAPVLSYSSQGLQAPLQSPLQPTDTTVAITPNFPPTPKSGERNAPNVYFDANPNEDVTVICKRALSKLESVVNEARERFGLTDPLGQL